MLSAGYVSKKICSCLVVATTVGLNWRELKKWREKIIGFGFYCSKWIAKSHVSKVSDPVVGDVNMTGTVLSRTWQRSHSSIVVSAIGTYFKAVLCKRID
jgi:hypothetical protein